MRKNKYLILIIITLLFSISLGCGEEKVINTNKNKESKLILKNRIRELGNEISINLIKHKSLLNITNYMNEIFQYNNSINGNEIEMKCNRTNINKLKEIDKTFPFDDVINALKYGDIHIYSEIFLDVFTKKGSKNKGAIYFLYNKKIDKWEIVEVTFNVE